MIEKYFNFDELLFTEVEEKKDSSDDEFEENDNDLC